MALGSARRDDGTNRNPPASLWVIGTAACSLLLGLLVVVLPSLALTLVVVTVLLASAWAFPRGAVIGCLAAAALHVGLFLSIRIYVGSFPLSLFDIVPPLLLISAIAVRSRTPDVGRGVAQVPAAIAGLFIAGLLIGPLVGLSSGADLYELLRVVRIELGLICAFAAAVIAAPVADWRRAVVTGLLIAGVIAGLEFLTSYLWYELTGKSFWAMFAFADVEGLNPDANVREGDIGAIKTVYVSIFLLFPALCVGAVGLGRWSRLLMALMLAAAFVSLIRGAWVGSVITLGTVLVATLWARDIRPTRMMRMGLLALPVLAAAAIVAGSLIQSRFDTSLNDADVSASYRLSESKEVFGRLTSDPISFVTGEGTGVVITHEKTIRNPKYKPSARLENNVLSRWTNLTLFSIIACALLFFGAALNGFRGLRAGIGDITDAKLSLMSLCLPAVWVGGLYGGSLLYLQVSLPFWILGGTMLAWGYAQRERRDDAG